MVLEDKLRRIAGWAGAVTCVLGTYVFLGWATDLPLPPLVPFGTPPMHAPVATCVALLGLALALQRNPRLNRVGYAGGVLALLLAAAMSAETALNLNLHVNTWFRREAAEAWPAALSGHVAGLLVIAAAALLTFVQPRGRRPWPVSAWLANFVIAIASAALVATIIWNRPEFSQPIRIPTDLSAALLVLGFGILLARPGDNHIRILFARNAAGILARRLFVAVGIFPVVFGSAVVALVGRELLEPAEGVLLFVAATVVSGLLVALFSVETAARMSESRDEAEQARLLLTARLQEQAVQLQETVSQRTRELREANASLRATAESNALLALVAQNTTNGVVIADADGRIEWVNAAFSRITGYELADVKGRKPGHLLQGAETSPATVEQLRQAERQGLPCHVEILNYTKQGRPFWQALDIQPVRDRSGRLVNFVANLTDITAERADKINLQQLTSRLQSANERLRLALRSSNYGVWEYDVLNRRRHWDDRVLEMYGLRPDQFDGSEAAWIKTFHPEDYPVVQAEVQRVINAPTGGDYDVQYRIIRPDGAVRHIEAHGHVQRDETGRVVRLVGLSRDITESKRLEQALELAEQRWQLAIEGTNDSVWDWDVTTGHVYHDERWRRILGYDVGELDNSIEGWKTLAHPEDLPENEAAIQEHFAQRTSYYCHELRMRAKDGSWRWILDRGKVVRRAPDGRPLRMVGTHSDVTERRELEERLRKTEQIAREVSRIAQIGGWEVDLQTSRVTWNDGTRRIHEVEDGFVPSLDAMWSFFPPEALPVVQSALSDATPAQPSFDVEVPMLTARGRRIWVRMLGHGEFTNGRAVSVRGAIQDITARHESEEARRTLEGQLFQAQKMETLGTLAGGIAHDFNNLLTGIIGYHELAADSLPENHPARECLVEARNASLRARELVEQILTFGRQSASVEHVPLDLVTVIAEARRFLRATLPANISIEVACAPGCGTVLGDATQIHQVILNLGSNAAHAMRAHGGTLKIAAEPAEVSPDLAMTLGGPPASSYVRLSVSDTGHGMDEATRRRIFDPFFTTKNTREGTGLGLAVVHGIVRSHRGAIDVESTPGRGSTFHIYIPAVPTENVAPEQIDDHAPRGGGEFVCVVDDEEVVGSCTKLVLESQGYQSLIFASAEQCLTELQANPGLCSVLVTDQTMPGMQGTELAAAIRRIKPDLPVVIMSGYFSKISPQALDELGQVELLAKPFTTEELAHAVHRALHPGAVKSQV
jgi:PAS domain S-box-containing protein